MRIIDIAIAVSLTIAGIGICDVPVSSSSTCQPDEVCYPIDPQEPKPGIPKNCIIDQEGSLVCNSN